VLQQRTLFVCSVFEDLENDVTIWVLIIRIRCSDLFLIIDLLEE